PPFSLLQRRRLRRAPDEDRRGGEAHPAGGAAAKPGEPGFGPAGLKPMSSGRPLISWTIVALMTAILTATTVVHVLEQYREFRSGWSWDLAYYNQWFWALTNGDGQLSVRPAAAYAEEGPSVWKTNYLAPIR